MSCLNKALVENKKEEKQEQEQEKKKDTPYYSFTAYYSLPTSPEKKENSLYQTQTYLTLLNKKCLKES